MSRRERLKRVVVVSLVLGLAVILIGSLVFAHVDIFQESQTTRRLREEGVEIAAQVIDLRKATSPRQVNYCEVEYQVALFEGETFTSRTTPDFCDVFSPGSEVEARYWPEDPRNSLDLVWAAGFQDIRLTLLLMLDTVLGALLLFPLARYLWRRR